MPIFATEAGEHGMPLVIKDLQIIDLWGKMRKHHHTINLLLVREPRGSEEQLVWFCEEKVT